uniref:N-acetylaspartate synthetase isoform X1 n=1 Tax=Podarcis muralis TaxID=64176 RepID=UPI00109F396E|nr:N-acetylaspartate synthetase isoform X1 [Podarcis muralis]
MHCLSPKMVCETKIVAEDHDSISGAKKESLLVSSSAQMWPSSRAGSGSPAAGPQLQPQPPPPSPAPDGEDQKKGVCIREFHPSEQEAVRRIFYEGIMERIPNTAFRGLKDQPWTQMVYGTMAVMCFVVTKSLLLTCCLPFFLMGMRYYFSRKVILSYLECALNTDMSDIEQYYMKSPVTSYQSMFSFSPWKQHGHYHARNLGGYEFLSPLVNVFSV